MSEEQDFPKSADRPRRRRLPRPSLKLTGFATGFLAVVLVAVLGLWLTASLRGRAKASAEVVSPTPTVGIQLERPLVTAAGLIDSCGISIVHVAVTGEGGLLDLRFLIVDPDKAAGVHDPNFPPALIDQSSGLVVNELFMGHSHTGRYQAGLTYYLIFQNPGDLVQRGGRVSVLLCDAQVEDVPVK